MDEFRAVDELIRAVGTAAGPSRRLVAVLRRPAATWRALGHLAHLPAVVLRPSAMATGARMRVQFGVRRCGVRTAAVGVATVHIPADVSAFLRGRSRQALRTNVRHAAAAGTTYRLVENSAEDRARLHDLAAKCGLVMSDREIWHWIRYQPDIFVAVDAEHRFVAACSFDVDAECALLDRVLTAPHGEGLYARYGLHLTVITELAARGVRALFAGPAYGIPGRLQYLQHLLGFCPTNVIVRPAR